MDKLEDGIFYFTDDFDKSMMDFVEEKWGGVYSKPLHWSLDDEALCVHLSYKPYTSTGVCETENVKKLTKQQFKGLVGMPNNKQFTKDDLKTGHLVVLRDGREFVVFRGCASLYQQEYCKDPDGTLINVKEEPSWKELRKYTESLTYIGIFDSGHDIMEVYLQSHPYSFVRGYEDDKRKLLWKREEKSEKDLKIEELQATIAKANEQINKLKEMD